MRYWFTLCCFLVLVYAHPKGTQIKDECNNRKCVGEEYRCWKGRCVCAPNFVPGLSQNTCVRCPGLGESCFGTCCDRGGNSTLHCWQGVCQHCYDAYGIWICRDMMDRILLVTVSQIAMATALVLGIIATFVLLCKLCSTTNSRPNSQSCDGSGTRLSIGSLQLYVEERLRDAPPSYTRSGPAAPVESPTAPASYFVNAGFIHDSSIPPPPYTPEIKENADPTVHI